MCICVRGVVCGIFSLIIILYNIIIKLIIFIIICISLQNLFLCKIWYDGLKMVFICFLLTFKQSAIHSILTDVTLGVVFIFTPTWLS